MKRSLVNDTLAVVRIGAVHRVQSPGKQPFYDNAGPDFLLQEMRHETLSDWVTQGTAGVSCGNTTHAHLGPCVDVAMVDPVDVHLTRRTARRPEWLIWSAPPTRRRARSKDHQFHQSC